MSTPKKYTPTQDAQNTVEKFQQLDSQFKARWNEFFERHQSEIEQLDNLRESRNVALDEAKRLLRDEAQRLDINKYKSFGYGPFEVQRKEQEHYRAEEFVRLAKDNGIDKRMRDEGVIQTKVEVDISAAKDFLKKNSLTDTFAITLDCTELTPAVSGPYPIPPLGAEAKLK